ncbi:MAG: DUF3833 family protein [Pseudomonadota bacterium]
MYFILGILGGLGAVWAFNNRFGFRAQTPEDYVTGPTFDIREVLNGSLLCDGVIYGPTGRVTSRFVAEFEAEWDGDNGVMREHFSYDSGTEQDREWRLSVGPNGEITADADDLDGTGTGRQSGSGVQLNYAIKLPESAGGHTLQVTDWMYLLENGTVINRSQFRKFGLKVGELVATMRPNPAAAEAQEAA